MIPSPIEGRLKQAGAVKKGYGEAARRLLSFLMVGAGLERTSRCHLVQSPLKAEIRRRSFGLYPVGSQKLPRMDVLVPPAPLLDHLRRGKHPPSLVPQTRQALRGGCAVLLMR